MYSSDIEKICKYCVWGKQAKGVPDYMQCEFDSGFYSVTHTCINFKYDILKKTVRRRADISSAGYTAADFSLD